MTIQALVWYNAAGEAASYSDSANPNLPAPGSSYGVIDYGYLVEITGRRTLGDVEWVKFIRRDSEGNPATLWMDRYDTVNGRKPGTAHPHCINIVNPGEPAPDSLFTGLPALGKVVCTVAAPLYTKDAGGKLIFFRTVRPGEMWWYDNEGDGYIRSGETTKYYFQRVRNLTEAINAPFDKLLLVGGATWAQVPELTDEGEPEPPEPPEPPVTDLAALTARVVKLEAADEAWKNVFLALRQLIAELTK